MTEASLIQLLNEKRKMTQSKKEKLNMFVCLSCGAERKRGKFIKAISGDKKGWFVKVCNSELCINKALCSDYDVVKKL